MSKKEKNPNNRIVDCYIAGYYGNTLMGLVYNNIAYSITSLQDKNESGAVYRTVDQIHEWIFWMSKKQIERAVATSQGWVGRDCLLEAQQTILCDRQKTTTNAPT